MRLGWRTKAILETLLFSSVDALDMLTQLRSSKPYYAGYDHDSEASRQLLRMERAGLIEIERREEQTEWIVRLTEAGKEKVCDSIAPETAWSETWNGQWTTLTFDIPAKEREKRRHLDLWLKKRRFGHMQNSVWVSHRPHPEIIADLEQQKVPTSWLAIIQGKVVSPKSNRELAQEFWNFAKINEAYQNYLTHLETPLAEETPETVKQWHLLESQLWKTAFEADPFLPDELLPSSYLGKDAWRKRTALFAAQHHS